MQLSQPSPRYRDTWVEISRSAIAHNVGQFKRFVAPSAQLMAVVKADGYGHGAIAAAEAALAAGANRLGVALLEEALELRAAGIRSPILVLGPVPANGSAIRAAIASGVALTAFTEDMVKEAAVQSASVRKRASLHLKLDTGMSRIGVTTGEEAVALANAGRFSDWIRWEGVFTHFADADGADPAYTRAQFARFQDMLADLANAGHAFELRHACNSAGTLNYPDMHLDMVRVGIAMYGLSPAARAHHHPVRLRQALRMATRVAAVKTVPKSQPIGYGCSSVADRDRTIAVLPAGYADGVPRLLSNRGGVRIRGRSAPIVGRVCMDQTMVDVTDIPECRAGDEAVLIGASGDGPADVAHIAEHTGTIDYEIVCRIGKRVPRVYV